MSSKKYQIDLFEARRQFWAAVAHVPLPSYMPDIIPLAHPWRAYTVGDCTLIWSVGSKAAFTPGNKLLGDI